MSKKFFAFFQAWSVVASLAVSVIAQPLPKVVLHSAFSAAKFNRPLWISESPDGTGRLFIVEQSGRILIGAKDSDGSSLAEFFNIVDRHPLGDNEEGLLSLAFHPGFKTNGLFYVYYNQQNSAPHDPFFHRRSVISEFKVSSNDPNKADLSSERILMEIPQPFGNHKGGEIAFGHDGYLYIGLGDGGLATDPFNNGQNPAALLAKILRIDVNGRTPGGADPRDRGLPYAIPSDNPFVNEPRMGGLGARPEIYAMGLRNPWRWSFDRETGELWVGDVGQDLWEEVDHVVKGGNYGWNVREAFHHFKPGPPGAHYDDPVMEYPHRPELLAESKFPDHSIGLCIIGGYVYRGKKYPALQGVYIYGDYNLGHIWGFRYSNGQVHENGTLLDQPRNITSFAEDGDGELYVTTFSGEPGDGHIFSIAAE
jgi:glucose/arabinose dehydrogenase